MKDERIVVYSGTRNLYPHMVTAVKSLLCHTRVDVVYLLIEDDVFPLPMPPCVKTINVSGQTYFPMDSPNAQTHLTYMVLMRAAYHRIFPQHDLVLSLDVDTLVIDDISGLWDDYHYEDYYLGAVLEPLCSAGGWLAKRLRYFNMGVAMLNLHNLRLTGMGDRIIDKINSGKTEAQEQGVFNEYCAGHILRLPTKYNSENPWTGQVKEPRILHFAGDREWWKRDELKPYRNISWRYTQCQDT